MSPASLTSLRKFVKARETEERCEMCGAFLPDPHSHQFDPASRRIRCACKTCSVIHSETYKEIPVAVRSLPKFNLTDAQWDDLLIPISLAFFSFSSPLNRMVALYPGPAGAAESLLRLDAWEEILEANTELHHMRPDVEALLVNRVGVAREYLIVPIDDCYKLVGLIRVHWRGLSGGAIVWGEIAQFFDGLRKRDLACPR